MLPIALLVSLFACTDPVYDGPAAVWDPSSPMLMDAPWPSDARRQGLGVDLSGFPNPNALPLIDTYVDLARSQDGYGTNAPIYVRFDAPLDVAALPAPRASMNADSPIQLVDVDPTSPYQGERFPVQWQYTSTATVYQPQDLLAVAPVFGFPLRPATTYALVVTTAVASPTPAFAEVWKPSHPEHDVYAPLDDTLPLLGLDRDDVAIATVFTTADPLDEMARLARFVREDVEPAVLSQRVIPLDEHLLYDVYVGDYVSPVFTEGERPYSGAGGGFAWRDDGRPIVQSWDTMRMAICVPKNLDEAPPGGWPVVIQQHGTGGSYLSHCNGSSGLEVASQLGTAGIVSIGIDQPLHGTRVGAVPASDIDHFNFLNPQAGRANFRQGAIDAVYLARSLAAAPAVFTLPDGGEIRLDPERVMFFGHSQGGLTGGLAIPFMSGDIDAAVLSGAGGGLAITLVERKEPVDIADLVHAFAGMDDAEALTELHPLTGMIQHLVEPTDPINAAPFWFDQRYDGIPDQRPVPVLLTSGMLDTETPTRTAESLAAAARMPQLAPGDHHAMALRLRRIDPAVPPLQGNVPAFDGTRVTSTFSQWPELDHQAVFTDTDLAEIYREFLRRSADGDPAITIE